MSKWKLWFLQVNQSVYEVEARSQEQARIKAEKQWKKEYYPPVCLGIEEVREITDDPKGWLKVQRLDGTLFDGLTSMLVPKDSITEEGETNDA